MSKEIIVLSLFDGMSCGQIALTELGYKPKYYASEIDKHAIKVTMHNFPDTIQLGDVTKWREWDIDWKSINLLLAGSPCQGFSFAGKQLAFDDPRSALFFVFVEILQHIQQANPNAKFLLENVRMKQEHENVISRMVGREPIMINSALVSAQNRVRLYWTDIYNQPQGLFGTPACMIPQPKDKGILLRDILETDVLDKYYLSDKMLQYFSTRAANFNQGKVNIRDENGKASTITSSSSSIDISDNFVCIDTKEMSNPDKSYCIDANYYKGGTLKNYIEKSRRQLIVQEHTPDTDGNSGGLHSDMTLIVASRGRNSENPKSRESGLNTEQMLEPRYDGKTNCLTSVQKDNLVMQLNQSTESNGCQPFQQNRVYDIDGISPALQAQLPQGSHKILIPEATKKGCTEINPDTHARIRRLTPTECKKLQTIPDWYDMTIVSDTQQYKMLGNGWTVDVIKHILAYLNQ